MIGKIGLRHWTHREVVVWSCLRAADRRIVLRVVGLVVALGIVALRVVVLLAEALVAVFLRTIVLGLI
jgi:hypothetical protein